DEVNHLKAEKEIYEKKQSEAISKMNNDNKLLKQQLDNVFIEIKQLKKEIQSKNIQICHYEKDKKENNSDNQLLHSNSPSKFNFDLFRSSSKLINTFTGHTKS
ncbi:hypothetical protein RFI_39293, partial [Reticulomyxa filosa]